MIDPLTGMPVDCSCNDTTNINRCGISSSTAELSGQCANSGNGPTDNWGWNLTEFSLSSQYLVGVAACGIPIGYYCKLKDKYSYLTFTLL